MSDYKQATADFELETKVRKICQQIFTILLKNHDNIFQYVKQNRGQMMKFEERVTKTQAECGLIDSKIDSRLNEISILSKDIQDIKQYCYQGLKTVNNDIEFFQRQVDELRLLLKEQNPIVQKTSKDTQRFAQQISNLKGLIQSVHQTTNEKIFKDSAKNTQQIQKVRSDIIHMLTQVAQAKDALQSKSERLDELTCDLELFKYYKPQITEKITQLYEQVANRALAVDVISNRKHFDDKVTGYFQNVNKTVAKLDNDVTKKIKDNEQRMQKIFKEQEQVTAKIKKQFQDSMNNSQLQQNKIIDIFNQKIAVVKESFQQRFQKAQTGIEEVDMQISAIKELSERNNKQLKKNLEQLEDRMKDRLYQYDDKLKYIEQRFTYNNKLLTDTQNQIDEIKQIIKDFRAQIQAFVHVQKQENNKLSQLDAKIDQKIRTLKEQVQQSVLKIDQIDTSVLESKQNIQQINKVLLQNKAESRSIKEEHMKMKESQQQKIESIQYEVKQFINSIQNRFVQIKDGLKNMEVLSQQLNSFSLRFKEQLAENDTLNKVVSDKIQNVYSQITKFKSDFTIKIDQQHKQIVKVSNELKVQEKIINNSILLLSVLSEALTIVTSCSLSRQYDVSDKTRDQVNQKFSSMFDGFVLEMDANKTFQDSIKYRGENLRRISLLANTLQYIIKQSDSLRKSESLGKQFESNKTVFGSIQPNKKYQLSDEGNTTRRNSVSMRTVNKKGDSFVEFPKISKKD